MKCGMIFRTMNILVRKYHFYIGHKLKLIINIFTFFQHETTTFGTIKILVCKYLIETVKSLKLIINILKFPLYLTTTYGNQHDRV